jgi:hypothetical protein
MIDIVDHWGKRGGGWAFACLALTQDNQGDGRSAVPGRCKMKWRPLTRNNNQPVKPVLPQAGDHAKLTCSTG